LTFRRLVASSGRVSHFFSARSPFQIVRNYLNSIDCEKLVSSSSSLLWTEEVNALDVATENERSDGRQFDENVDGWA
jgi:hypothetical protein